MTIEDLEEELSNIFSKFKIKIVKGEIVIYTSMKKELSGELVDIDEEVEEEECEEEIPDAEDGDLIDE